jgi:subtilisin
MRRMTLTLLVIPLLLGLLPGVGAASAPRASTGERMPTVAANGPVVPDSYIVVVADAEPAAVAQAHARAHAAQVTRVYRFALRGYAARLSERAAAAIARDPRVVSVEPETLQTIDAQTLPTGIDRIEVDRTPSVTTTGAGTAVAVPVAVIDTGIADHPDLNVAGRMDCTVVTGGSIFNRRYSCIAGGTDTNGHGTHVAGTIAAKDDGAGVVGVAPGAPLYAVKVCPTSSCPDGAILAGIDWLAGERASGALGVAAANFSISSADSSNDCANPANATHRAICGLVDQGVVFAMAAGNEGRLKVPYPVALSVSAIADFDGMAGGQAGPTCRTDVDDTLADYSNYGPAVRLAAPGTCIESTWLAGGYNTISGTSMATPHATGAVALYLHANGLLPAADAAGVRAIEDAITGAALPQGTAKHACSYDDAKLGGPLLFTNGAGFGGDGTCGVATPDDPPEPGLLTLALRDVSKVSGTVWRPAVAATVSANGAPAAGATVEASWSGVLTGSGSCTTASDGTCQVSLGSTKNRGTIEVLVTSVGGSDEWLGASSIALSR